MERILPEAARVGIERMIEFAYSFEPVFAPTVVLGKLVNVCVTRLPVGCLLQK